MTTTPSPPEPTRLILPAPTSAGTFDHYELVQRVEVDDGHGTLPLTRLQS